MEKDTTRKQLFETTTLAGMRLPNRLVRSATWEGLGAADGEVTREVLEIYRELADGGVGLIISSYLFTEVVGQQVVGQLGAHCNTMLPGLQRLADAVHEHRGVLVGQIVHCGGQANREHNGGQRPVAPSAVESPGYPEIPRALIPDQINEIVRAFADAAARLQIAGFDGVQLHGAHGYLLAQFLSPLRNRRTDSYGGSLENRTRFGLEVYRAVRTAVGDTFPVMMKLNVNDFLEGSTTEEDARALVAALAEEGIDAIEVSGGTPGSGKLGAARPDIRTETDEAYFLPQAEAIRKAAPDVPLMLVGGMRSPELMERILAAGGADYFSMSRPLIREPDLPRRWRDGDLERAACVSCLGCFGPARSGDGIRCVQEDRRRSNSG